MILHSSAHPNHELCATPCYNYICCDHHRSELGNATLCACYGKLNTTDQRKVKFTSYKGSLCFMHVSWFW